jgi:TetR/AcrR family transcriptional regulator, transcriptional repressor for nem operon
MSGKKAFEPDQALKKAMDLFWERGYEGSSIEDLLQSTGLGRGSLYATFGDKHSLYLAALDYYCAHGFEEMVTLQQQSGSLQEVLEHLFQTYIDGLLCDPAHRGCFLVNANIELAPRDPEVFKKVASAYQNIEEVFFSLLSKAQASGEFARTSDPRQFAHFFLGILISIRVQARARADRGVLEDMMKTALLVLR